MGGGNSRQNLNYVFDAVGNLTSRNDANAGLTESFGCDNLYRLTSASVNGGTPITVAYAANGNITNKSDVGAYAYGSRLHAVARLCRNTQAAECSNPQSRHWGRFGPNSKPRAILHGPIFVHAPRRPTWRLTKPW